MNADSVSPSPTKSVNSVENAFAINTRPSSATGLSKLPPIASPPSSAHHNQLISRNQLSSTSRPLTCPVNPVLESASPKSMSEPDAINRLEVAMSKNFLDSKQDKIGELIIDC